MVTCGVGSVMATSEVEGVTGEVLEREVDAEEAGESDGAEERDVMVRTERAGEETDQLGASGGARSGVPREL